MAPVATNPATASSVFPAGDPTKLPINSAPFIKTGPNASAIGNNAAFNWSTADCIDLSKVWAVLPCLAISSALSFSSFNCWGVSFEILSWLDITSFNLSLDIPVAAANACCAKTFPFRDFMFSFMSLSSSAAAVAVSPVNAAYLNLSKFRSFCKYISASISLAIELSKSKWVSAAAAISSIDKPNLFAVWAALANPSAPPFILYLTELLALTIPSIMLPISDEKLVAESNSLTVSTILSYMLENGTFVSADILNKPDACSTDRPI